VTLTLSPEDMLEIQAENNSDSSSSNESNK
jgi:hypothetical protein